MSWLLSHAINPALAKACGVTGEPGGRIYFPYQREDGSEFIRARSADGKAMQPKDEPLRLWWPVGGRGSKVVLLCEGEGDTLAAASVLCDSQGDPANDLPEPLVGVCPVGLPGVGAWRKAVAELSDCHTVYVALDNDPDKLNEATGKIEPGPGPKAAAKLLPALAVEGVKAYRVLLAEGMDLADCLRAAENNRPEWLATALIEAEEVKALLPRPKAPQPTTPLEDDFKSIEPRVWIERLTGVEVPRDGMIHCPLPAHEGERTPSFKVYDGDRGVYCFGCQGGGDIYSFAQAYWGCDFREARRRLAETLGSLAPKAAEAVELAEAKARLKAGG